MTPFFKKAACVLDIIFFRDPNFPDKLNIPPPPSDLNIKACRPMCTARIIGWGRSRTIYPGKEMEFIQSTRLFVFLLPRIPEHQKKFPLSPSLWRDMGIWKMFFHILFCLIGHDLLLLIFPFLSSTKKVSTCNTSFFKKCLFFKKVRFLRIFFCKNGRIRSNTTHLFIYPLFPFPFFRGNAVVYFANCRKKLFPAGRGR